MRLTDRNVEYLDVLCATDHGLADEQQYPLEGFPTKQQWKTFGIHPINSCALAPQR